MANNATRAAPGLGSLQLVGKRRRVVPGGGQPGAAGEAGQERLLFLASFKRSKPPPPEGGTHPETGRETVKSVPPVSFYRKSQVKSIRSFFKVERLSSTRSDRRIDMYLCFLFETTVSTAASLAEILHVPNQTQQRSCVEDRHVGTVSRPRSGVEDEVVVVSSEAHQTGERGRYTRIAPRLTAHHESTAHHTMNPWTSRPRTAIPSSTKPPRAAGQPAAVVPSEAARAAAAHTKRGQQASGGGRTR